MKPSFLHIPILNPILYNPYTPLERFPFEMQTLEQAGHFVDIRRHTRQRREQQALAFREGQGRKGAEGVGWKEF